MSAAPAAINKSLIGVLTQKDTGNGCWNSLRSIRVDLVTSPPCTNFKGGKKGLAPNTVYRGIPDHESAGADNNRILADKLIRIT